MVETIKNKKLLLIDPPFYQLYKDTYTSNIYPLSHGYIASYIKKNTSWDVLVYNSDFSVKREPFNIEYFRNEGFKNYIKNLKNISLKPWKKINNIISDYNPSVIGISVKSPTVASALNIAEMAKEINKNIKIIIGGPHAAITKEKLLTNPLIDIVVPGEGEKVLSQILFSIENRGDLCNIKGIIYRKNKGSIINPPAPPIKNLDLLSFPSQYASQVLYSYKKHTPDCFSHIMAIRGCIYNCSFCSSPYIWGNVRFRSPENITQEILKLREENINFIHFEDDTFGVNNKYLKKLTEEIKTKIPDLKWSCEIHVNLVTEENILLMKKAGCTLVKMGIESGNNRILKTINKGFTIEKALEKCELIKKHGLNLEVFFMAGFPEETEKTINDTYRAIKSINCNKVIYSIFTPYKGTKAFNYCLEKGLIPEYYNPIFYNHQSPLNCFTENITPERFKELSARIEKLVSEKNKKYREKKMNLYSNLCQP